MFQGSETKSLNNIWGKIHVVITTHSVLLIVKDLLNDSENLNEAKSKIEKLIEDLRNNNCEEFKEWLKRYLHI